MSPSSAPARSITNDRRAGTPERLPPADRSRRYSEGFQPLHELVHEMHTRVVRVAPAAEVGPAHPPVAERFVQAARGGEVVAGPRVEDDTGRTQRPRPFLERLHQRAAGAAASVLLFHLEVVDESEPARLDHLVDAGVVLPAEADPSDGDALDPGDELDEAGVPLVLLESRAMLRRLAGGNPGDDRVEVVAIDLSHFDHRVSPGIRRRAFAEYTCATTSIGRSSPLMLQRPCDGGSSGSAS